MLTKFVTTLTIAGTVFGGGATDPGAIKAYLPKPAPVVKPAPAPAPKPTVQTKPQPPAPKFFPAPLYKQYDNRWGYDRMGGGAYMKDQGCVVASVSMALTYWGIPINYGQPTPGALNNWLKGNGGYSRNSIIWSSVTKLSLTHLKFQGRYHRQSDIPVGLLRSYLDGGNRAVIANVRNGGHWVLLTRHNGGTVFTVNDPGYNQATYNYSDFVGYAVYTLQ